MKKLLTLLILSCALFSCSSDDPFSRECNKVSFAKGSGERQGDVYFGELFNYNEESIYIVLTNEKEVFAFGAFCKNPIHEKRHYLSFWREQNEHIIKCYHCNAFLSAETGLPDRETYEGNPSAEIFDCTYDEATETFDLIFCEDNRSKDNREIEEVFTWNGDWNDPNDPNYKPEGYNPIQGLWRNVDPEKKSAYFSEDFKLYTVTFRSNDNYSKSYWDDYIINDIGYKYVNGRGTWWYKIEGAKLTEMFTDGRIYNEYYKVQE